jgi:hypothetical protein
MENEIKNTYFQFFYIFFIETKKTERLKKLMLFIELKIRVCSLKMNLMIQNFCVDDVFCKNSFLVC